MKPSEVLSSAALLLEKSEWLRGRWAKDAEGHDCDPSDPQAIGFCLLGALQATCGIDRRVSSNVGDWDNYGKAHGYVSDIASPQHPAVFNDQVAKDKRQVVRVLRKASKLAASKGD